jgi:hypothetical protein
MHVSRICILCRSNKPDSKEHIIPDIIGGRIKAKILCRDCNSVMGTRIENTFKTDPMIKIAFENLKETLPQLYKDYTSNSNFVGFDEERKEIKMKKYKKGLKIKTIKKLNGSIIVDTNRAPKILRNMINNNKVLEEKALNSRILELENGKMIKVTNAINIKKNTLNRITPDLTTPTLDNRAILLVLYEFFYLMCFGEQMLDDSYNFIREYIINGKNDGRINIERYYTRQDYLPLHILICNEGESLEAKFIIFNSIYNILKINGIKLPNNKGYIFIDDIQKKKFYYNNNLEEARNNIFKSF